MKILVAAGGAHYIGSDCCVTLLDEDYDIVVLDNLSNSNELSLPKVENNIEKTFLCEGGANFLEKVFKQHQFSAAVHFAVKSVA
ncbi:NAD-dependent epimerase/dehydratase family protein [Roseibium aggregatum]|uniref:NAD-dependent epimerase/dehydratase family protein n=1 Tax=Roseibium aggregatum TaxID=187304 RepID=UPI001A8EE723|nr:NAD-dependent epimerase/dehydratase family protein [Roseibium aggregatum]MBN8180043.1 NAD-dependent epimerase/dehydratase family protein [Roseibium aggregatum]UES45794.1 NAD-dependent epimerase/dehydratase family protein [Roseibium aggregatum]